MKNLLLLLCLSSSCALANVPKLISVTHNGRLEHLWVYSKGDEVSRVTNAQTGHDRAIDAALLRSLPGTRNRGPQNRAILPAGGVIKDPVS